MEQGGRARPSAGGEKSVRVQKASCVYRGNTFYCDYMVTGAGALEEVRVRYNGEDLTARTGGRRPDAVAEALLAELVVLEAVAMKVAEAFPQHDPAGVIRGDARERRAA